MSSIDGLTWQDAAKHLDYRCEYYEDDLDIQWVSYFHKGVLTVTAMDMSNNVEESWEFIPK